MVQDITFSILFCLGTVVLLSTCRWVAVVGCGLFGVLMACGWSNPATMRSLLLACPTTSAAVVLQFWCSSYSVLESCGTVVCFAPACFLLTLKFDAPYDSDSLIFVMIWHYDKLMLSSSWHFDFDHTWHIIVVAVVSRATTHLRSLPCLTVSRWRNQWRRRWHCQGLRIRASTLCMAG